MKVKKSLVLSALILLATLTLTTPNASAMVWVGDGPWGGGTGGGSSVYQATATHSVCNPTLTLAVAIDTSADIWTAKWQGEAYLVTPIPSVFYAFTIKFEDDFGFSEEYTSWLGEDLDPSGTITIEGYSHSGTWTHTWCQWEYFFPLPSGFGFELPELWVDLYIG